MNNNFTGAFSYGMAVTSATNFTVEGNTMIGNTSFIGARGPNCSTSDTVPSPAPFIVELDTVTSSTLQTEFQSINDGDSLTCVLPPNGGDFWPYGLNPSNATAVAAAAAAGKRTTGIAVGVVLGVLGCAVASWFFRKWYISHTETKRLYSSSRKASYVQRL